MTDSSIDPTAVPSSTTPISSSRPPAPVTISACMAPKRADSYLSPLKPMSRNEVMLVSSHMMNNVSRLPANTVPSMAPAKISMMVWKRAVSASSSK